MLRFVFDKSAASRIAFPLAVALVAAGLVMVGLGRLQERTQPPEPPRAPESRLTPVVSAAGQLEEHSSATAVSRGGRAPEQAAASAHETSEGADGSAKSPGLASPSPLQAAAAAAAARNKGGHPLRVGLQAGHWNVRLTTRDGVLLTFDDGVRQFV